MKFKPTQKGGGVVVELRRQEQQMPGVGDLKIRAFKLKKILVPIDYSAHSKKALAYAVAFAKQFEAEIVLIHVVRPYPLGPEMAPVEMESIKDAKTELQELRTGIDPGVHSQPVVRTGEPWTEIVGTARELQVDLIIVSTHGRTGLAHLLLGGTAEKIVRHAPCPVLVVRREEHDFVPAQNAPSS